VGKVTISNIFGAGAGVPLQPAFITGNVGNGTQQIQANTVGFSGPMPFAGNFVGWSIAEVSSVPIDSTISVEIWKSTSGSYPPTLLDVISGSEPPTLTSQKVASFSPLTTWTTDFSVGDCFAFNVASTDGAATKIQIILWIMRIVQ